MTPLIPLFIILLLLLFSPRIQSSSFPSQALPTRSGYLPIDPTSNSSLFFTFYEAQTPTSPLPQTPLLLWLQGGPGCSSMLGNFFELGPFLAPPSPQPLLLEPPLRPPNHRQPHRATGFASPPPLRHPPQPITVANHLIFALNNFLSSDPSIRSRPFYVTGESYAGKYVPALGYYILKRNELLAAKKRINLQGVAIGNGLTHPAAQVATHADSAYFSGLISERQKKDVEELQDEAIRLVNERNWSAATDARNKVLRKLENITGLATLYDLRRKKPYQTEIVATLMNQREIQEALGAKEGLRWEECSETVSEALHEDVMKSAKFMVEEIVKRSRVLLYQGVFDLRDGVVSTEAWMKEMEWEGLEGFLEEERSVWRVDGEVAGHVQGWRGLTHVVVGGGGGRTRGGVHRP
ncbi:uncharacterized protein A4U43_C04F8480 [Asparagus officinalis]|uniref:Carboxypeptidase n=1 Tax=Asparagus officinalis TaxID=4686 RepID=A0A5P1F3R4_ASPOF|nr:uncharacterized protein A4U43_C04F8480 [Asparagus officinalis]